MPLPIYDVLFPAFYDDLAAFEIESKGYLDNVRVEFSDGRCYSLSFRDAWNVQLNNDATGLTSGGVRYLAIPNLVILDVVSRINVLDAIRVLVGSPYFDRLGSE